MSFRAGQVIPVLRIFSVEKAREFYVDYMGCKIDWEHRFDERAPLYMQVSRDGLVLHLSEHYGDSSPGVSFKVNAAGVRELHAELSAKNYGYWRPGLNKTFYGMLQLKMLDPFGNQIFLEEPLASEPESGSEDTAAKD
jgi:catechol 2,3-dioxygenase-like lactoylglutathione lyase family enzyme